MFSFLKDLLTAREPGAGYFGGAEGALRFLILMVLVIVVIIVLWIAGVFQ